MIQERLHVIAPMIIMMELVFILGMLQVPSPVLPLILTPKPVTILTAKPVITLIPNPVTVVAILIPNPVTILTAKPAITLIPKPAITLIPKPAITLIPNPPITLIPSPLTSLLARQNFGYMTAVLVQEVRVNQLPLILENRLALK